MHGRARTRPSIYPAILVVAVGVACAGDDSVATTETSTTTTTASTSSDATSTTGDETNTSDESTATSTGTSTATTSGTSGEETIGETTSGSTTDDTTTSTTGSLPDDIPEPFNQYCVAVFTEAFDPPYAGFSITPGDSFLYVFTINDFHEMKYFGDDGPVSFKFDAAEDNLPFVDNCDGLYYWSVKEYLAVLADVTLYVDKEMTEVACTLTAGTVTPYGAGGGHGPAEYVEGGIVFQFDYFALPDICDGYDTGYAFVPEIVFFDTMEFPLPLDSIYRPV